MFRYFARLYEQYELPVYPIALFSCTAPLRDEQHQHSIAFPNKTVLEFNYDVIQLNRLNWRDFVRQSNPIAGTLMARMGIAPNERPKVKLACLNLLVRLKLDEKRQRLIGRFIDTYLRLNVVEEQQFQTELAAIAPKRKEAVMDVLTSWEERGMVLGIEQGIERGRQQEAATFVLRQLTRRLGRLTAELEKQIKARSIVQLEDLGEALLDFTNATELMTWLQNNQ